MHPNSDVNILLVVSEVSEAARQLLDILRRQPAYYSVQINEMNHSYRLTCIHLVFEWMDPLTHRTLKLTFPSMFRTLGMIHSPIHSLS